MNGFLDSPVGVFFSLVSMGLIIDALIPEKVSTFVANYVFHLKKVHPLHFEAAMITALLSKFFDENGKEKEPTFSFTLFILLIICIFWGIVLVINRFPDKFFNENTGLSTFSGIIVSDGTGMPWPVVVFVWTLAASIPTSIFFIPMYGVSLYASKWLWFGRINASEHFILRALADISLSSILPIILHFITIYFISDINALVWFFMVLSVHAALVMIALSILIAVSIHVYSVCLRGVIHGLKITHGNEADGVFRYPVATVFGISGILYTLATILFSMSHR